MQSCYYSQTQASIHVTIRHRHALNDSDGVGSLPDAPLLVTEHIFVISPHCKHDHHSVHQCQGLIADYLKSVQYNATVMHEFTDGCSVQYKSRHCMGDVSFSVTDFSFFTIRNYYEMKEVSVKATDISTTVHAFGRSAMKIHQNI